MIIIMIIMIMIMNIMIVIMTRMIIILEVRACGLCTGSTNKSEGSCVP